MSRYRLSRRADDDLAEIWDYVAAHNLPAADRLLEIFRAKLDLLSRQPQLGTTRHDLLPNLRVFPCGNYVIFYREHSGVVHVLRLLHGSRDYESFDWNDVLTDEDEEL